jgi:hypothetical protein
MMIVRNSPRLGQRPESLAAFPVPQPSAHFAWKAAKLAHSSTFFRPSARSAELCAAHLRAKHLGKHEAAHITKSGNAGERPVLRERGYALHAIPCVGLRCLAEGPRHPARDTTGAHMKGTDNA